MGTDELKTEAGAIAEAAKIIAEEADAQFAFSRSRPARNQEACDAELDRLLADVSALARCIASLAHAIELSTSGDKP